MRGRKFRSVGVIAGVCIAACAAGTARAEGEAGYLRIGTSLTQMPWGFFDQGSKPTGVDVAMCGALAKQLGETPRFVNLDFKGLIPALQADRFDIVCAAMYVTPERQSVIQMVPYIQASQTIIARQNATFRSAADLCGHPVSVLQGSGSMKVLQDENEKCHAAGKPDIAIQAFDTQPVALRALENNSVEGFIATDSLVSYFMSHNAGYKKIATGISPMALGIGVPKNDAALAARVRKGLEAMKADGTYQSILKTWGIESAAVSSF
jgi:polar amino acid transport system substrate-binding protein